MAPLDALLAATVLAHLVISVLHGRAHTAARVDLSAPAFAFVLTVILAAPIVGLLLRWWSARTGAWVIAAALLGSFVFGVVNHFAIEGTDHVSHVAEPWRATFAITAALLAATEALGSGLAVWSAVRSRRTA
jgi:hypothetical protein